MTNLDYEVIKKGQEVEALIQMPGWVHVKEYIDNRMSRVANDLCNKRIVDIHEVIRLQAEYSTLKGVLNRIERIIGDYHRELQKEVKEG